MNDKPIFKIASTPLDKDAEKEVNSEKYYKDWIKPLDQTAFDELVSNGQWVEAVDELVDSIKVNCKPKKGLMNRYTKKRRPKKRK